MLRIFILCVFAWGVMHPLLGQISYLQSDYAAVGDTFVLSRAFPPPGAGLGQDGSGLSWDLFTLSPNGQRVARFGDPDQAGYRLTWITQCVFQGGNPFTCPSQWNSLTNLTEDVTEQPNLLFDFLPIDFSDRTRHYQLANDRLIERLLGLTVGTAFPIPLIVDFSQPDTLLTFPLSLGQQDSSVAAYDIDYTNLGAPIASYTQLKRLRNVSGEGSLTTPFGTYPQVVKLETVIQQRDSIILGPDSSVVLENTRLEYQWFDPAFGHPVLTARGSLVFGLPVFTEVEYLDSLRCIEPNAFFLALPNPVIFDNQASSATVTFTPLVQNADSFRWALQDGTISDADGLFVHTYTQAGVYDVELVACNSFCNPPRCDTFVLPVAVVDTTQPLAFFTPDPSETCVGLPVAFANNSLNAESYLWQFGDGDTSTQEAPTHVYQQADSFTVTLIAARGGNTDTATRMVRIRPQPSVTVGPDTTITQGQSLTLQSTLSHGPASYDWTPGTGLSCTNCPSPTAQPDSTTTYRLVVTNSCGQDTASLQVVVTPSVGMREEPAEKVRIFPNPNGGRFTVAWPSRQAGVWQLTDLLGRPLGQGRAAAGRFSLQLDHLPPGVYALRLRGEGMSQHLIRIE